MTAIKSKLEELIREHKNGSAIESEKITGHVAAECFLGRMM